MSKSAETIEQHVQPSPGQYYREFSFEAGIGAPQSHSMQHLQKMKQVIEYFSLNITQKFKFWSDPSQPAVITVYQKGLWGDPWHENMSFDPSLCSFIQ